ncbi:Core-2/I-Branching enzyme [Musa troglodytarum]|uniref:Core-2/I-Branching enzyme n=1 Tax=Musa troglodytarum TaxID=320322 RepID=A0A9E7JPM6_9LILI|nr:Core-2/I-Branching enzyme [Musa troglodytarum]
MKETSRFDLRRMHSSVCSSDDVAVLVRVFAVLLLLVVALSVVSTSTEKKLWVWSVSTEEEISYRPPTSLMHNMSDEQLFEHAMRGDYALNSVFYKRQIPSTVSDSKSFSTIDAARRLLANALLDLSNERFVLLSPACIPLFNFSFTYKYLMSSKYSFVEAFDVPGPGARGRYTPKLAPEVGLSQWRKGTQWLEVSRRVALVVVNDTTVYPKFDRLRSEMIVQHEHYFPTVLTVKAAHIIANRSITWELWRSGQFEPVTFGMEDTTETLLRKMNEEHECSHNDKPTAVCFLFARRFAPSALWPLLKLAPTSLGFGSRETS